MTLKRSIPVLAVAAALAAPAALAQQGQSSGRGDAFSRMDRDGDGYVTQQEWRSAHGAAGGAAQARGMPAEVVVITLTPVDQRLISEQQRESVFRSLDTNSNGSISLSEAGVNTQLLNAFARLDRDGNGIIERQEFTSVHIDAGSGQQQAGSGSAAAGGTSGDGSGGSSASPERRQ